VLKWQLGVARLLDLDDQRNAAFRTAKRKRLAGVLVRDLVHDLETGVIAKLDHTPANLNFLVRIVKIDHRQCLARIASQIAYLKTAFPAAKHDFVFTHANPHRRYVGRTVRHQRCYVSEIRTRQQGDDFWIECHGNLLGRILPVQIPVGRFEVPLNSSTPWFT
jgi:hypothetical protein